MFDEQRTAKRKAETMTLILAVKLVVAIVGMLVTVEVWNAVLPDGNDD
jgi:hypothetical protein